MSTINILKTYLKTGIIYFTFRFSSIPYQSYFSAGGWGLALRGYFDILAFRICAVVQGMVFRPFQDQGFLIFKINQGQSIDLVCFNCLGCWWLV